MTWRCVYCGATRKNSLLHSVHNHDITCDEHIPFACLVSFAKFANFEWWLRINWLHDNDEGSM